MPQPHFTKLSSKISQEELNSEIDQIGKILVSSIQDISLSNMFISLTLYFQLKYATDEHAPIQSWSEALT